MLYTSRVTVAVHLQAQLDALREAYASGATRVSYESRSVDYRTGRVG